MALVAIGIGRTQRGFERYFTDLFSVLKDDVDITLFKSAGEQTVRERIPPLLHTATSVSRAILPLGTVGNGTEYRHYKHDCVAYGLTLMADLVRHGFDIVQVIDYPLSRVLERLLKLYPRIQMLFTNGCNMPPQIYPRIGHVQHVAQPLYQDALMWGVPASRMTLAPCGIHTQRFATRATRHELRSKYGISENTFVILTVSAVKRAHKRIDHVIREVSNIQGDVLLWIDGHPEDPSIPELARQTLKSRCRITHVPSNDVGELYNLADVMVHPALEESFGLSIVEGLSTGLLVLAHDSPHFQWLVQDGSCLLDMSQPRILSDRLRHLALNRDLCARNPKRAAMIRERFDWNSVKQAYIDMYYKVAGMNVATAAAS